jgi:hypothetical protein
LVDHILFVHADLLWLFDNRAFSILLNLIGQLAANFVGGGGHTIEVSETVIWAYHAKHDNYYHLTAELMAR